MRLLLLSLSLFLSVGCDHQQEVKQQKVMKQLAEAQSQPIDGGSVRKVYRRVLK